MKLSTAIELAPAPIVIQFPELFSAMKMFFKITSNPNWILVKCLIRTSGFFLSRYVQMADFEIVDILFGMSKFSRIVEAVLVQSPVFEIFFRGLIIFKNHLGCYKHFDNGLNNPANFFGWPILNLKPFFGVPKISGIAKPALVRIPSFWDIFWCSIIEENRQSCYRHFDNGLNYPINFLAGQFLNLKPFLISQK